MPERLAVASAILLAVSQAGCSSPAVPIVPSPTPTATATPAPPRALPNARALDNLALVRAQEAASGRASALRSVFAPGVRLDGTIADGDSWSYAFIDAVGPTNLYQWAVLGTGAMFLFTGQSTPGTVADIGPGLMVNSDQAITLGIANGGRSYVRRHPDAKASLTARRLANTVVWQVHFIVPGRQICDLGPITIDATTGELLASDLSCTS